MLCWKLKRKYIEISSNMLNKFNRPSATVMVVEEL